MSFNTQRSSRTAAICQFNLAIILRWHPTVRVRRRRDGVHRRPLLGLEEAAALIQAYLPHCLAWTETSNSSFAILLGGQVLAVLH